MLLNLQSIEERFHVRVISWHRDRTFSRVKKLKKCAQLFAQSLGLVFAAGKGLSLEVNASEIARRGHYRGWLGKQER